jgi:uncharacterized lipoprotein YddW (UPF0748 family)
VATVANTDWPSQPGLSSARQQAELIAILDRAARLRFNAVIFQVRPTCDALYSSPHEPWAEYLTGRMGRPPEPYYDPLELAVREAHARGLELHAWFNPFRARHAESRSPPAPSHVTQRRPDLVRSYGRQLWLDPTLADSQEYALRAILDVVRRYDVDGVHLDDYFYPYPEKDAAGRVIPFPDGPGWSAYVSAGGRLSRDDWRRANINGFVERLCREVRAARADVKVGISPFGIWRPGHPPAVRGLDAYGTLYADSRLWLARGWVDYLAPQLYWRIDQPQQSFPLLLRWWVRQNARGRHIWPGCFASRVGAPGPAPWPAEEIARQVQVTRATPGAGGNVLFSARAVMENRSGLADVLARSVYTTAALPPASPWLDDTPPAPPRFEARRDRWSGAIRLRWTATGPEPARLWLLRMEVGGRWMVVVLPAERRDYELRPAELGGPPAVLALCAVDRAGNLSAPVLIR